jgi:hypothetical protein
MANASIYGFAISIINDICYHLAKIFQNHEAFVFLLLYPIITAIVIAAIAMAAIIVPIGMLGLGIGGVATL